MTIADAKTLLREKNLRATKARVGVLLFLETKKAPIGIETVAKHASDVNLVTLYRMMDDFVAAGIVRRYNLGHGHIDYELADRPHHHHAVCTDCGLVEDLVDCDETCDFEKAMTRKSKQFKDLRQAPMTFFGVCRSCK